jgi:hypothetical protein
MAARFVPPFSTRHKFPGRRVPNAEREPVS